jgi:hypothetical protein
LSCKAIPNIYNISKAERSILRSYASIDRIRFARVEDIAAMKLDVISNGGRKKDFWDIHEYLETFELNTMIGW